MPKFTKKAQYFIIGLMVLIIAVVGFIFIPKDNKEEKQGKEIITVVKENINIKADHLDFVSKDKGSDQYTLYNLTVKSGEEVAGYKISKDQSFSKYLQLTGPDGKEVLTKKSKEVISHYAYSTLLTGDIIEKNNNGNKTYEIVNARITYNRIPFTLLEIENKAIIRNNDKDEIKIISFTDFSNNLKDIEKRKEIINW